MWTRLMCSDTWLHKVNVTNCTQTGAVRKQNIYQEKSVISFVFTKRPKYCWLGESAHFQCSHSKKPKLTRQKQKPNEFWFYNLIATRLGMVQEMVHRHFLHRPSNSVLLKFASNVRKNIEKDHSKGAIPMNKAKIRLIASQKPLK